MKASNPARAALSAVLALCCAVGLAGCNTATVVPAATVNGTAIAEETVTTYIENFRASSSLEDDSAWGTWLSNNGYTPQSVREEVVDYYVDQELTKQAAQERGVSADAAKVDEAVQKAKEGYESDEAWREALEASSTTEEAYREQVELSLLKTALSESFDEAEQPDDQQVLESATTYAGAKRSSCILFASDSADEAEDVRASIESGDVEFADAAKEHSADESAQTGGDKGWDALVPVGEAYAKALADLGKDEMSDLVETDDGTYLIMCTDEFSVPEGGLTDLAQVPEALLESVRTGFEGSTTSAYNEWFSTFKEKAEITINPIPEKISYNIDLPSPTE